MRKNKRLNLGLAALLTTLVFIGGCIPAEETSEETSTWSMLIFLALIFAVLYFLMIRPQRKRQKDQKELMQELRKGDKVITAGGIYGVIETVSEDSIVIKVESGTTMRVAKGSVALKREV